MKSILTQKKSVSIKIFFIFLNYTGNLAISYCRLSNLGVGFGYGYTKDVISGKFDEL